MKENSVLVWAIWICAINVVVSAVGKSGIQVGTSGLSTKFSWSVF